MIYVLFYHTYATISRSFIQKDFMLPRLNVYALPKFVDPDELAGGTVVVIDVLRSSTSIVFALQAGAKAVIPCREIGEAQTISAQFPRGEAILGGERGGVPINGFDLGNSPEEYTPTMVQGKAIVFTSTNGTQALLHAKKAKQVFIGAFVNASAVIQKLLGNDEIHLLCAGTDGQLSEDDILLAGMTVDRLQRRRGGMYELNVQAIASQDLWWHTLDINQSSATDPLKPELLAKTLRQSLGGKNLVELGLDCDILCASQIDRFQIVPQFNPKTSRIQLVM
jgi:2-phosphosulfolactate phosphatase